MGEITFLLGAAFEAQSTRGTAATMPVVGSGSGTGGAIENVTDGAVLGDPTAGKGETGITFSLGKKITEKAFITGSFSRNFANFVSRTLTSFSIAVPLKGNGETTTGTPVAADFTPDIGIIALMRAAGFASGASGATWGFTPTPADLITAALYFGNEGSNGGRIILRDMVAESLVFSFVPGEVAVSTFNLSGEYDSHDESGTWPSAAFEYGNQSSLSAPAVTGVAFTWGPDTPAARSIGFSELSITVDLQSETHGAANATSGEATRQTGLTITVRGIIDATDGEFLYELDQLGEDTIADAEALSFTVGTAATGSDTANAYSFTINDPELISLEPERLGNSQAWSIELVARASAADAEFRMLYL